MIKNNLKKVIAVSLTMVLAIAMSVPFKTMEVKADGTSAPSDTAYASREDLQTKYDLDGTNDIVGKIEFGKSESLNAINWYIAGKDTSIPNDNVTLFATDCIFDYGGGKPFLMVTEGEGDPTFSYEANTGYGDTAGSISVNIYHYGISEMRRELNEFSSSGTKFNDIEKSVMNKTTLSYYDYRNLNRFTISDYLYLADKGDDMNIINVGGDTDNPLIINTEYCRDEGNTFWLRSMIEVEMAFSYFYVNGTDREWSPTYGYYTARKVRPAVNINLTTIPFASAVPVGASASGTIPSGSAMTFRITPSESIGEAYYSDNAIIAKAGNVNEPVNLIVQGKDATAGDWYYVKEVSAREIITASTIKTALNLTNDIALDECEVWVEQVSNGVAYAETGRQVDGINFVSSIDITSVETPVGGQEFDVSALCDTVGISDSTPEVKYEVAGVEVTSDKADYNTVYTAVFTMKLLTGANDIYYYDDVVTATVNGKSATVTKVDDTTVKVSYTFEATEEFVYEIVEGMNSAQTKKSNGTITIVGNGDINEFKEIKVDNVKVDETNYTISDTESSITLLSTYIDTLAVGTHTFEMIWEGGSARTSFVINERSDEEETTTSTEEETTTSTDEEETTIGEESEDKDNGTDEEGVGGNEDNEVTDEDDESEEESKEDTSDNKDDTVTAPTTGDNNSFVFLGFMILVSILGVVVARRLKKIED